MTIMATRQSCFTSWRTRSYVSSDEDADEDEDIGIETSVCSADIDTKERVVQSIECVMVCCGAALRVDDACAAAGCNRSASEVCMACHQDCAAAADLLMVYGQLMLQDCTLAQLHLLLK